MAGTDNVHVRKGDAKPPSLIQGSNAPMPPSPIVAPTRRKLPARYASILLPFFLTLFMTIVVSGISTLKSLGFTAAFWSNWPVAWMLSWLVAFPTVLVVLPLVRRLVAFLVEQPDQT